MIRIKEILANTIVKRFFSYYIFTIINSIIGFISISFLTRQLLPEEYGYIGIFTSFIFFMPSLISFCTIGLQGIYIIDLDKKNYIYFRNCLLSFIIISFSFFLFISLIIAYCYPEYTFLIFCILFQSLFTTLITIHMTELVQNKQALLWGILSSVTAFLALILTIIFVGYFNYGWKGRLFSIVFVDFVILLFRYYKFSTILKEFRFTIDRNQIKYYFNYGFPIFISLGATWIITNSDRYILLHYYGMEEVGLYAASMGIASILATLNSIVVKVFVPDIYQILRDKKGYNEIKKISLIYSLIVIVFAFIISLSTFYLIEYLFGEKYTETPPIITIICISQAFFGIYSIKGLILDYYKLNKLKTTILWICAGVSITVSLSLINICGIYSPALGTMFGFLTLAILAHVFSKKYITKVILNNLTNE